MLHDTKIFLTSNFEMEDLGEASYVLGIDIQRDRSKWMLGLTQKENFKRVLKKYNPHKCSPAPTPNVKGGHFNVWGA